MVVMEYKLSLADDFRIGDTIMITSRTSSGWKGMINSKHEISFELDNDDAVPMLLNGWILVDVNDRWEKMWVCCKEHPFQIGFFKSEQDKIEKMKKNENLYLEPLVQVEELEVVQATNPQNPPIRFSFRTQNKSYSTILPTKDGMVNTARSINKALKNKEKGLSKPPSKPVQIPQPQNTSNNNSSGNQQLSRSAPHTSPSPIHSHALTQHREQVLSHSQPQQQTEPHHHLKHQNLVPLPNPQLKHTTPPPVALTQTQAHIQNPSHNLPPAKTVQIQAPPPTGRASPNQSPSPTQSQIGGGKWLANIKSIVNPKAASSLNVVKGKDDQKKAQSVVMAKSNSAPEFGHTRNTQGVMLSTRPAPGPVKLMEPAKVGDRKMLTRVYWRDGTYHTVPVTPNITAKEVCEFCTKKTKVAIFENLFCLYECLADGSERILDPKTNVHELLLGWGEESENHLICDLNLGTKNTVKTQLRKTLAVRAEPDSDYDSESEIDLDDDFGNLDNLDSEPTEEDESVAMMIQEMIKLKHQLQEEDEMIERLAVEEQEVDMLISRLANL